MACRRHHVTNLHGWDTYRAIGDLAFPAVKIRGRYIVPAIAIEALARDATRSNTCVDVSDYAVTRRSADAS